MHGTFIFNKKTDEVYVHDMRPTQSKTAHERLLAVLGWDPHDCIAGSIKNDGKIDFRSKSINEEFNGMHDMAHSKYAEKIKELVDQNKIKPLNSKNFEIVLNRSALTYTLQFHRYANIGKTIGALDPSFMDRALYEK